MQRAGAPWAFPSEDRAFGCMPGAVTQGGGRQPFCRPAKLRPKLDSVAHEQGVLGHLQQGPLEQDSPGITE